MENFEEKLLNDIQLRILHGINNCEFIGVSYNDKINIPKDFIQDVYKSIDVEMVKQLIKENLEKEMADKITNKLITEYSNDIKQIMCNKELREELRSYARNVIKNIYNEVSE